MISAKHLAWFDGRCIDPETVDRFGIFSGRRELDGAVVPDGAGEILAFPYFDKLAAEPGAKYRAPGKKFWQKVGARKTFWNADILDDPSLADGRNALVITEGEMDALSVSQAGYPFVVSVPDGAPPARDGAGRKIEVPKDGADVDPEHDAKFGFVFNNWDRLKKVKRIIIATDADEPGQRLAEELVRRLDRVRCSWISMPEGCKDLNEVLVRDGAAAVLNLIVTAKAYPVSGIYKLSDIPEEPDFHPVSTGWRALDDKLKVFTPCLMVVTGPASHGKSTWTQQLAAHLVLEQGWPVAIATFEMRVKPYVADALSTALIGRGKWFKDSEAWRCNWTPSEQRQAEAWVEENFVFIAPDPDAEDDANDVEWLIERAEVAVIRHGARVLIVDPWNEIDHARRRDESQTEYVGRAIRDLKRFASRFGVLVILVAHPSKNGALKAPADISLYDISDSAHFANKADLGVVIARQGSMSHDTLTSIFVKKVRYQPQTGMPGEITLDFDRETRMFSQ